MSDKTPKDVTGPMGDGLGSPVKLPTVREPNAAELNEFYQKAAMARAALRAKLPYLNSMINVMVARPRLYVDDTDLDEVAQDAELDARRPPLAFVTAGGQLFLEHRMFCRLHSTQAAALYAHEAMHLLEDHFSRAERRGVPKTQPFPNIANIAMDLSINSRLRSMGMAIEFTYRDLGVPLPKGADKHNEMHPNRKITLDSNMGCFPEDFELPEGLIWEEYYALLLEQTVIIDVQPQDVDKSSKELIEQWEAESGEKVGKRRVYLRFPGPANGECGSGAGNPVPGEPKDDGPGSQARSQRDLERAREDTARAIKEAAKQAGNVPDDLLRWAEAELKPPQIPWQSQLRATYAYTKRYMEGYMESTYARTSRRQPGIGFGKGVPVLSTLRRPKFRTWLVFDTSGSMGTDEGELAMSETVGILKASNGDVMFMANDVESTGLKEVRSVAEVKKLCRGGGGTDFNPPFEQYERTPACDRPQIIVFVTDSYGPAPAEPPRGCQTIWVVTNAQNSRPYGPDGQPIDWGKFIYINNS